MDEEIQQMASDIAVLTSKQQRLEVDVLDMRSEVRRVSECIVEITSTVKTLRWILTLAVPTGLGLGGVILARLLQVE